MHLIFTEGCGLATNGTINTNTNAKKRITTLDFINISSAQKTNSVPISDNGYNENITYSVDSGYRLYICFYDEPSESTTNKNHTDWLTGSGTLTLPTYENANLYMRVCLASDSDSSTLTKADASHATISLYPTIKSVIEKIVKWGLVFKGAADTTSFDNTVDVGLYTVRSTSHESTTNNPISGKSGSMIVIPANTSASLTPQRVMQLTQICVSETGQDVYFRRVSGASTKTFGNWYRLMAGDIAEIRACTPAQSALTADDFEVGALTSSGGSTDNDNRIRTKGYVSTDIYNCVRYSIADGYRAYFVPFSDNSSNANLTVSNWVQGNGVFYFPDNAKYYRFQIASIGDTTALTTADYTKATLVFDYPINDRFVPIVERTNWLAIGDSLTRGVYSTGTIPNGESEYSPESIEEFDGQNGWVQQLAGSLGYKVKVLGYRGMGFDSSGHYGNWEDALDAVEAQTDDYNLITVAVGTNDYGTQSASLEDIATAIDAGIARITAKYPKARLVFITPFNRYLRNSETKAMNTDCNASIHWGRGYENGGKTLTDIADLIKARCDHFGIECIYATNNFLFHDYNITRLLPDGVHPSPECHRLIAKAMAHYLIG